MVALPQNAFSRSFEKFLVEKFRDSQIHQQKLHKMILKKSFCGGFSGFTA